MKIATITGKKSRGKPTENRRTVCTTCCFDLHPPIGFGSRVTIASFLNIADRRPSWSNRSTLARGWAGWIHRVWTVTLLTRDLFHRVARVSIYRSTEERRRDSIVCCLTRFESVFMQGRIFLSQSRYSCLFNLRKRWKEKQRIFVNKLNQIIGRNSN